MTREDGTRRTRAMVAACEGISTEALEAGAVAKVIEALKPLAAGRLHLDALDVMRAETALALIKGEQQ